MRSLFSRRTLVLTMLLFLTGMPLASPATPPSSPSTPECLAKVLYSETDPPPPTQSQSKPKPQTHSRILSPTLPRTPSNPPRILEVNSSLDSNEKQYFIMCDEL